MADRTPLGFKKTGSWLDVSGFVTILAAVLLTKRGETMTKDPNDPTKGFVVRDHRFWLHDDGPEQDPTQTQAVHPPTYVEDLETRLAEKDRTLRDYIDAHKSSVSDMGEARSRMEKDFDRRVSLEVAKHVEGLLEIRDNLTRFQDACQKTNSVENLSQGIDLLLKRFDELLLRQGIERIKTAGLKFDPTTMEALLTTEGPLEQEGMVLEEVRAGYARATLVIRPAGVRVGVTKQG
jgi:molecular chaperone GrpE